MFQIQDCVKYVEKKRPSHIHFLEAHPFPEALPLPHHLLLGVRVDGPHGGELNTPDSTDKPLRAVASSTDLDTLGEGEDNSQQTPHKEVKKPVKGETSDETPQKPQKTGRPRPETLDFIEVDENVDPNPALPTPPPNSPQPPAVAVASEYLFLLQEPTDNIGDTSLHDVASSAELATQGPGEGMQNIDVIPLEIPVTLIHPKLNSLQADENEHFNAKQGNEEVRKDKANDKSNDLDNQDGT
ncbi:unnamed protein product, partial [Mesorhabditis spiculigera]